MEELVQYLKEIGKENQSVLILGHPHADPDAVGSVIGLGGILKSLGAEVTMGVPSGLSRLSKSVMKSLNREITVDPPLEADYVVILDTSSLGQLKNYEENIEKRGVKTIIIDHHHPNEEMKEKAALRYIDEDAASTVEIILELGLKMNFEFEDEDLTLMLTGIISDTGHFRLANEKTFRAVATSLKNGADYGRALEALKTPEDPSKRVAMLKAAQRSEPQKSHGKWIVFSEIGAYESDAAAMFIKIGADVSLVANTNEKLRISSRSRSGLASETHLHLGKLMKDLADHFGGTGGGHAGAAAMTVKAELGEVKEKVLKEVKKSLKPREV